ncbi:MAG: hypothetical protein A2Y15_04420 [Clostridiales bacterium GWF2_36_10]|nr:MAG: hypothetical protein A2Y15_04420 [Clostridiales bacterium GWF2_36_10]
MKKIIAIILTCLLVIPMGIIFSSAEETNVAADKSYTKLGDGYATEPKYADTDGKELTDGVIVTIKDDNNATGAEWVGFHNSLKGGTETSGAAFYEVTIDLGAIEDNLIRFVTYSEHHWAYGIEAPTDVIISVSEDGATFTEAGSAAADVANLIRIKADEDDEEKVGVSDVIYTLNLNEGTRGRYVKFHITAGVATNFTFINELEVYQGDSVAEESEESQVLEPAEAYSLIDFDETKWLVGDPVANETATVTKSGNAIVVSGSVASYPYAYYNIETPVTVNIDDFELVYDFTVSGDGSANIVLFCEGSTVEDNSNYISDLTHAIVEDGDPQRPNEGDDIIDGTYTGKIKLSDLNLEHVTLLEEGKIQISAVKVYTVNGGVVTINKFAIESIATLEVSEDESEDESEDTSLEASSTDDTSSTPGTGDNGMIIFVVAAVISMISVFAFATKKRIKQ